MLVKHLIAELSRLNPESEVVIQLASVNGLSYNDIVDVVDYISDRLEFEQDEEAYEDEISHPTISETLKGIVGVGDVTVIQVDDDDTYNFKYWKPQPK